MKNEISGFVKQRDFLIAQHQQAIKLEKEWKHTLERATSEYKETKNDSNVEKIAITELEEKLTQSRRISVLAAEEVLFFNKSFIYKKQGCQKAWSPKKTWNLKI